jgi:hypothetical protein
MLCTFGRDRATFEYCNVSAISDETPSVTRAGNERRSKICLLFNLSPTQLPSQNPIHDISTIQ